MSVGEAARLVGVSAPTMRRLFDKGLPDSGQVEQAGRTGEKERRVNPEWAAALRDQRRPPATEGEGASPAGEAP